MADPVYGLTPNGPNIKRLDTIADEIHTSLSKQWGVNTRQDPESFLSHFITNISDKIAELWEFGEDVYFSQYPSFAEGTSLDNAAQYGGSTRETAAKSYYPIHCKGIDGTVLASGTLLSSATNPATQLVLADDRIISRSAFNKVRIKIASLNSGSTYTAAINGTVFSYSPETEHDENDADAVLSILSGLAEAITDRSFEVCLDRENEVLCIDAADITSTNTLVLSENLTTETVTSIITFGTADTGNILLPEKVITNIVKADAGLLEVTNLCGYIAGRNEETDTEFRQSYADKIFNRSTMMLESIRSAILKNVQGVSSVAPYENPSHEWDEYGRPPHSIEIVVDGGDSVQIAKQILQKKAGGINTYGNTTVILSGEYDEDIPIRFNRPVRIYTWFRMGITLRKNEALPPNYTDLLRGAVLLHMDALNAGDDVIPQEFMSDLYRACSGISYIDIRLFVSDSSNESPAGAEDYTERSIAVTARQRAYTAESMIEVEIDG